MIILTLKYFSILAYFSVYMHCGGGLAQLFDSVPYGH